MENQSDIKRQDLIKQTCQYVETLDKIIPTSDEIHLCKTLHNDRIKCKDVYNKKNPLSLAKESKISRNHADGDLWWGLLAEFEVAKLYGKDITYNWYLDQVRQNKKVLTTGIYDCKDIGHTQVRAAEHSYNSPRRIIYRDNDFRTKSCQPVIGCIVNTNVVNIWVRICGFMSWEDLKARKQEFWDDPDRRGFPAMFIPYWELTPMAKFNRTWLLE